jgi:hypothetical protein
VHKLNRWQCEAHQILLLLLLVVVVMVGGWHREGQCIASA